MYVVVPNLCVQTNHDDNDDNDDNHPNIKPSRFLFMGWEVRGNLEIGNNPTHRYKTVMLLRSAMEMSRFLFWVTVINLFV